jgi:hypothetical protein
MGHRSFGKFAKLSRALLAPAALLPLVCGPVSAQATAMTTFKPLFDVLPPHGRQPHHAPGVQLTQWNGIFTDLTGKVVDFTMVGTNPQTSSRPTDFTVYLIPIKMVYGKSNGNHVFDPNTHHVKNGNTMVEDLLASPLFNPIDFKAGNVDLGTMQYESAFQRANFWTYVQNLGNSYQVVFDPPTVLSEQTLKVSEQDGQVIKNPFGTGEVGEMDMKVFDTYLQKYIKKFPQIKPNSLALFITDAIFLTQSGVCCVGGYHSAMGTQPGGQTYAYATYIDEYGSFSQNVSAFSHELGEWMDDPFGENLVNCTDNNHMEVGDPLETENNFGDYPYVLNGTTYDLQSLVFIEYFGYFPNGSVNGWLSFQNDMNHVCPGQ